MMETREPGEGRKWIRGKVVVILLGLLVVICAAVLVTDRLSKRERGVAPTTGTQGATTRAAGSSTANATTRHGSGGGL